MAAFFVLPKIWVFFVHLATYHTKCRQKWFCSSFSWKNLPLPRFCFSIATNLKWAEILLTNPDVHCYKIVGFINVLAGCLCMHFCLFQMVWKRCPLTALVAVLLPPTSHGTQRAPVSYVSASKCHIPCRETHTGEHSYRKRVGWLLCAYVPNFKNLSHNGERLGTRWKSLVGNLQ